MRFRPLLSGLLFLASRDALAAPVNVTSPAELIAAINAAKAGDEIILADGSYSVSQNLSCNANGSQGAPIVVRAANPQKATILFDALEGFKVSGKQWRFVDLVVRGVCADDSNCEHAFHVTGDADDFALLGCTVRDFNAQLKVNASKDGQGAWQTPDRGLIEGCDLGDDHPRKTSNPVTKLNIDTGDDWIVRGNFIHDFRKDGGNEISYGAFMKSGGKRGLFERNLVTCSYNDQSGGTRIGLSFGGGGTGAQFCAPAFDAAVPCSVEHEDGVLRNNIIASCSDVGIYLNRAKNTRVLHNTLIATSGVDFRFDTTSGEADGNLLAGKIRDRDGATHAEKNNLAEVPPSDFLAWYKGPVSGDLSLKGDTASLVGKVPQRPDVVDDYCLRPRPAGLATLGALEHSLGDCSTFPPPEGPGGAAGSGQAGGGGAGGSGQTGSGGSGDPGGSGGSGQAGSGTAGSAGNPAGTGGGAGTGGSAGAGGSAGTSGSAGTGGATAGTGGATAGTGGKAGSNGGGPAAGGSGGSTAPGAGTSEDEGGCGCRATPASAAPPWGLAALALLLRRRRR